MQGRAEVNWEMLQLLILNIGGITTFKIDGFPINKPSLDTSPTIP